MQVKEELQAQLDVAKRRLNELTEEVARNDEKMRRTQRRELKLLQAEDLDSLLKVLIEGLKLSYGLEYVSVVLCDPDHDIRHLLIANGTPPEGYANLLITESLTGLAPQYVALHKPWLGAFAACDHQLICPNADALNSMAMIPLKYRGKLMGSINLCSKDAVRFHGDHAGGLLEHLGVIASFCVENTINRARMLRSGFTDVLTGWNNRRYLTVRLGEELARARRDRAGIVCLMLDVDHFKRVNDTWGHAAGDAVLSELARRIETQVRASDVAARYGGEEFVVLLPNTLVESGMLLAERIRNEIAKTPFDLPCGETVGITVSIGISESHPQPDDEDLKTLGDSLIARADVALYAAKSAGRDRVFIESA